MNTRNNKLFITGFVAPCVIVLLGIYFYPVMRTFVMSFFKAGGVTADMADWQWRGLANYERLILSPDFQKSLWNMARLFIYGGVLLTVFAIIFGVLLSAKADLPGRNFFRTILYMPNLMSAIAIGNAFTYYVFQNEFGLLVSVEKFIVETDVNIVNWLFGDNPLHELMIKDGNTIKWMTGDTKFYSMMFAVLFCSVGYHMLIYISGIEGIPDDLYEAAVLDGAGPLKKFFYITLPLMKGTIRTSITFWSISALQMFAWNQVFSPLGAESSTISPIVYMYEVLFGSALSQVESDAGLGAAVGILTALLVQVIYNLMNWLLRSNDLEY